MSRRLPRQRQAKLTKDVQQARHALEAMLPGLNNASRGVTIIRDLERWSPESLLLLNALLHSWILDGVIRLIGVSDDPALTGQEMQRHAQEILLSGDMLDALAKLGVQSRDYIAVACILILLHDHWRIHRETLRRLAKLRQGQEWVALLQEPDVRTARRRMFSLANEPWVYGKPLWSWHRLPKDSPDAPNAREGREERMDVAMEAMTALYDRVRRGVSPQTIGYMPGPLVGRGKPVPRWDAVAAQVQRDNLTDIQRTLLPAFEMEKGRLLILDAFKARNEAASAQKRTGEAVEVEEVDTDQPPGHTEAVTTDGIHVSEILNYARQHFTAKMFHAFELLAGDENMTDVDAAKEAEVTPQGIREARKRLREVFRKDSSPA